MSRKSMVVIAIIVIAAMVLTGGALGYKALFGSQPKAFSIVSAGTPKIETAANEKISQTIARIQAERAEAARKAQEAAAQQAAAAQSASAGAGAGVGGGAASSGAGYSEADILAYLAANATDASGSSGGGDSYVPSTGFDPWTGNNGETWSSGNAQW